MRSDSSSDKRGIRATPDSPDFILEFDSIDSEFQRGFECGEIWACLTDDVEEVHSIITADNAEMVMRMAEATGYTYSGRYLSDKESEALQIGPGEWLIVVLRNANDTECE
jgi:hypothetical protein